MKRIYLLLSMLFLVALYANSQVQNYEDVVYLKNGSVIRGTIIEQVPGKTLKIQTSEGNIFVYNVDDVEKMTKEASLSVKQNANYGVSSSNVSYKNPGLAFLFSFLLPGGGQYYNGEITKGIIIDATWLTSLALIVSAEDEGPIYAGLLLYSATAIYQLIDAPLSASRINRQNGLALMNLDLKNDMKLSLTPDVQLSSLPVQLTGKTIDPTLGLKLKLSL